MEGLGSVCKSVSFVAGQKDVIAFQDACRECTHFPNVYSPVPVSPRTFSFRTFEAGVCKL